MGSTGRRFTLGRCSCCKAVHIVHFIDQGERCQRCQPEYWAWCTTTTLLLREVLPPEASILVLAYAEDLNRFSYVRRNRREILDTILLGKAFTPSPFYDMLNTWRNFYYPRPFRLRNPQWYPTLPTELIMDFLLPLPSAKGSEDEGLLS